MPHNVQIGAGGEDGIRREAAAVGVISNRGEPCRCTFSITAGRLQSHVAGESQPVGVEVQQRSVLVDEDAPDRAALLAQSPQNDLR